MAHHSFPFESMIKRKKEVEGVKQLLLWIENGLVLERIKREKRHNRFFLQMYCGVAKWKEENNLLSPHGVGLKS